MKRAFSFLCVLMILTVSVFADYDAGSEIDCEEVFSVGFEIDALADLSGATSTIDTTIPQDGQVSGDIDMVSSDSVLTDISLTSLPPVTASDATGLKAAMLSVLGSYEPVVVVYQYQTSSSGYSSYVTQIQPDFVWLASAAVLALFILCLFRLGGALLRG